MTFNSIRNRVRILYSCYLVILLSSCAMSPEEYIKRHQEFYSKDENKIASYKAMNRPDLAGMTLSTACTENKLSTIRLVFDAFPKLTKEIWGDTKISRLDACLILSLKSGKASLSSATYLLNLGANINAEWNQMGMWKQTPLGAFLMTRNDQMKAISASFSSGDHQEKSVEEAASIVSFLVDNGADVHFKNLDGSTYASQVEEPELIQILASKGLKFDAQREKLIAEANKIRKAIDFINSFQ